MKVKDYTSQSIITNTFFSIASKIVPLLIAVICIPIIIKGLGEEKYGALTIALVFIGYFNLFDLGIGRAITKFISERVGKNKDTEIVEIYRTGVRLTFGLGIFGGVLFFLISKPITIYYIKPPQHLLQEILAGLNYLSIGIPFTILINSYRGVLEALHEFKAITFSQIILGVITYLGLIVALQFTTDLGILIGYLSAVKLIHFLIYYGITRAKIPTIEISNSFNKSFATKMLGFGGWITVSTVVSPIMSMLDRLVIASKSGMEQVAYYATSNEITQRVGILPTALVGVLFPVFSKNSGFNTQQNSKLYGFSFDLMMCGSVLFGVFFIGTAEDLLSIWIDEGFAEQSFLVLQIIAIGAVFNFMARIPFTFIQGLNRPDITAKFHLLELPIFLIMLYLLIDVYGITGAAIATTVRMILDFILLHGFTVRTFRMPSKIFSLLTVCSIPIGASFFITLLELNSSINLAIIALMMTVVVSVFWIFIFEDELKSKMINLIKTRNSD